jgi:hypothetical protein
MGIGSRLIVAALPRHEHFTALFICRWMEGGVGNPMVSGHALRHAGEGFAAGIGEEVV